MAEKIEMEVESNLGDVSKDAKNAAGNLSVMGISLNTVKAGFKSAGAGAKLMFGSIKMGLISTGIGAFLLAILALGKYFTSTEQGASKLKTVFAAFGVVVGNLEDILADMGEKLVSVFENPKKAVADLWEAIKTNLVNRVTGLIDGFGAVGKVIQGVLDLDFDKVKEGALEYGESVSLVVTGVDNVFEKVKDGIEGTINSVKEFGKQTKKEVKQAIKLEQDRLELQIFEREAIVEKARTEKDMMKLRLQARDFEKFTAEERLEFMREANTLASEQLKKDLHVAREKLKFRVEENTYSKSNQANLDEEAQLQAAVFNLERSNFSERKRLKSEEQAIVKEIAATEKSVIMQQNKEIAAIEKEIAASKKLDLKALTDFNLQRIKDETDEEFKIRIAAFKKIADAQIIEDKRVAKEQEDLDKLIEKTKEETIAMGFSTAASLAKEGSATAKAIGVAETIYNTQTAIMAAMKLPPPFNAIQAGLTGVMGATAIAKILSTNPEDGGGSLSGGATATNTPAPQMMSGAFDLSGGVAPDPVQAFVLTDEMTNSQNQLANIRRRATI